MSIEVITVVLRYLVVLVQQAMQNGDCVASISGFFQPAAGSNQVFVALGYVTSTGITHLTLRVSFLCRSLAARGSG
jgi:hypothetical protein